MNGNISEQPVVELLREINSSRLSGTLRLEQERAKAAIYVEEGIVVFAASNLRNFRLREYLAKEGSLSEAQLSSLPNINSDSALATMITTKGLLDAQTVKNLFVSTIADLLRVVLLWTTGTWEFDNRSRLADSSLVKLNTKDLLLEASRKMDQAFVTSRWTNDEEILSPAMQQPESVTVLPQEAFVLSRIDRPMSLNELTMVSGMPEVEARRTIYGLALAGYVARQSWPNALRGGTIKPKPVPKPAAPPPPEPVQRNEEAELQGFLDRQSSASNHYEVLNVAETAEVDEIKRSYYTIARNYHPDRFHSNEALHARVESAFARVTQAYETVIDPRRRSAYDSKLAAQKKSRRMADAAPKARSGESDSAATDSSVGAEERFKEGYAALKLGQASLAITHLAAAAQAAPREPRYRAYYGQALASQGRSQRLAEIELQTAVKLEPKNAEYRVMLAQLYCDLGFSKRARAEVDRALELDANNSTAKTLLRKIESTG